MEKAESVLCECLVAVLDLHGKNTDHENVSLSLCGLGKTMLKIGFFEEADRLFQNYFDMDRRLHMTQPDQDDISMIQYWRGVVSMEKGTLEEAKSLFLESLEMERQVEIEFYDNHTIPPILSHMAKIVMRE